MDQKTKELIGIAAAYASGCEECLVYHIHQAKEAGLTRKDVLIAMRIADRVKQASVSFLDEAAGEAMKEFEQEQTE